MDWNAYFINMLDVVKQKSKDKSTKVGAIIVGKNHNILSTGFNGFPRGVIDDENNISAYTSPHIQQNLKKEILKRYDRPDKYMWTEHAERNAIFNAARHGVALDGSSIYIDWIPCARCARAIIQSGIVSVIIDARDEEAKETYWNERWGDDMKIAKQMLKESGVMLVRYKPKE